MELLDTDKNILQVWHMTFIWTKNCLLHIYSIFFLDFCTVYHVCPSIVHNLHDFSIFPLLVLKQEVSHMDRSM